MQRVFDMDYGWKFSLDNTHDEVANTHRELYMGVKAGKIGGEVSKTFNDSEWKEVTLPHDYVMCSDIKQEYGFRDCHKRESAWYRKSFSLDSSFKGKQVALCFEGIAIHAEIYFNGSLIRRSFSSYTEQFIDITDRVYIGGRANTLVVHVDPSTKHSEMWTYEGGGIYRHVKLYAKDNKTHIAHNGIFAHPEIIDKNKNIWNLHVDTEIENTSYEDGDFSLRIELYYKGEKTAEFCSDENKVEQNGCKIVKCSYKIENPKLWDVDSPNLYDLTVKVISNGKVVDEETVRIGFRYYYFDSENGFFLNGRYLKIKGIACHQDHAGVGVAVPDAVQYERVKILKDMGANMYRSAHNNTSIEIMNACDELGLLVMDENRRFESSEENLRHIGIVTKRDRNHPSVFLYCLFNEEPLQNTEEGRNIYKRIKNEVLKHDDTRLFTGAMHGNVEGAGEEMDVCGINYGYGYLDALHKNNPEVCILGSENDSQISTRGCYSTDKEGKHVISSYDDECVPWGSTVKFNWNFARSRKYMSGVTIWNGFDYHGEPIMDFPTVNSEYGLSDMCGFPKGVFYVQKSCFCDKPMVKLLPHWNWNKGDKVKVIVVSNCQETELIVNGESYGKKSSDCCAPNEFTVDFKDGYIEAKGYNGGVLVATDIEKTSGAPKNIVYEVNKKSFDNYGNDVIIMNLSVADERGIVNPIAENKLFFETEGDIELIGTGNGNPNCHENESKPERSLYYGKCQAIFRIKHNAKAGKITVKGKGLNSAVFVPEIIEKSYLPSIESAKDNYISGFTATAPSEEWIDPKQYIDADDMNSLLPLEIEENSFQADYHHGWRLYRTFITLPKLFVGEDKKRDFTLYFDDVRINKMFVFVDGEEIYKTDITHRYTEGSIVCEFSGKENAVVELRVLVHINIESEDGAGFRKSIRIV